MTLWSRLRSWVQAMLRRSQMESEMDAELRFHIEELAEDLVRGGLSRQEAMRRARMEFGGIERAKEECRNERRVSLVDSLMQDMRFSVRQIRRNSGFTLAVASTRAMGMGANTAVFSILHTVLLRPLPYRDPDRLVTVWQENVQRQQLDKATVADFNDWKTRNRVFDDLAFSWDAAYTLTGPGDSQSVMGYQFSANFFSLLGARPLLGRTFLPEEGTQGRDHVVVLSYQFWRNRFASDEDVIGRTIQLDGDHYIVIGVMPSDFGHPSAGTDIWTPLPFPVELLENRRLHVFQVIANLRSGVSLAQARQELESLAQENARRYPQTNQHWGIQLKPIRDTYTGNVRPALWVLQAAVLFMLIIACANVGNMLLAREQHISNIGAGNDQHEQHGRLEDPQCRSHVSRIGVANRFELDTPVLVCLWIPACVFLG